MIDCRRGNCRHAGLNGQLDLKKRRLPQFWLPASAKIILRPLNGDAVRPRLAQRERSRAETTPWGRPWAFLPLTYARGNAE